MSEGFIDIMRDTKLPIEEVDALENNPFGLTKEGCEHEIKLWKTSSNKYRIQFYETMLKKCKNFTSSGKTEDGKVILSRDSTGKVKWAEKLD